MTRMWVAEGVRVIYGEVMVINGGNLRLWMGGVEVMGGGS